MVWWFSAQSKTSNHKIHGPSKIAQCVKDKISEAVTSNHALTPTDISCGKGLGFIPAAVDSASSHSGNISYEVTKTKVKTGIKQKYWFPSKFEHEADIIDESDNTLSDDEKNTLKRCTENGRPYLVACGYEEGVNYIFTMLPIMENILASSDFIQCDITYDDCTDYPYIFNAVAFNNVTMEWMVIGRLRLNKQNASAYGLAFKKVFGKCSTSNSSFKLGETLLVLSLTGLTHKLMDLRKQ